MRPAEILVEMLLDEANPVAWARQTWGKFKQSRLAQNMGLMKQQQLQQQRQRYKPFTTKVTPAAAIKHIAIIYGPDLPPNGYYVTGVSLPSVMEKLIMAMRHKFGDQATDASDLKAVIDSWIVGGYQLYVSIRGTNGNSLLYYGEEPHALDKDTARILGATAGSHVEARRRAGDPTKLLPIKIV